MITENIIQAEKTARFYTLGKLSKNTINLWFVFHGYGQLAKDFISEFLILENENTFIIAPEAMNKFYIRGFNGKVGATWMTKEDRENEINNYVNMIDSVYKKIISQIKTNKITINVLGFSQGTHTAVRWLNYKKRKIDNLILWSGTIPHDCDYSIKINYWLNLNITLVVGNKDKYITEEKIINEKMFFKSHNLNINFYKFSGGHEIDEKTLIQLKEVL